MKDAVDPSIEEVCRQKTLDVVSAMQKGGDTLASMTHSIREGLDGLRMLRDMGDSDGTKYFAFTLRLAEVCMRKQQELLKEIAAAN